MAQEGDLEDLEIGGIEFLEDWAAGGLHSQDSGKGSEVHNFLSSTQLSGHEGAEVLTEERRIAGYL